MQSKNGVDLVEVSISYKSEKTSGQTVWPIKIKAVALFYLNMATYGEFGFSRQDLD